MKQSLLFIIATFFLFCPLFAQYEVSGGNSQPLSVHKNGITEIYLLNGLDGAQIKFTSSQPGEHQWYRYKESIEDAVSVPCTQNGNISSITDIQEGYGYYVDAHMATGYIWIVDYSLYVPRISGLKVEEDEYRCEQLKLIADADVPTVYYYTGTGGRRNVLQRNFRLTYNTLSWNEEQKTFLPSEAALTVTELFPEILVDNPPLTNTAFTLTDVFADHFGITQAAVSEEYRAIKVEAHYSVEKDREFGDNEKYTPDKMESAPIGYTFTAYANEPVATFYIWKVSKQDPVTGEYSNTIVRYTDPVLRYTFKNTGNYEVQLEVDDAQSICTDMPEAIKVSIDSTRIEIPNAFSPGSSPGVNDELKVSFSSVLSFQASVFNRWGNLLYRWTDPAKGWNGMVNGKFVPTGAYLLVVEYTDSVGKKRSKSQMVNILRSKN
ncbi:MAG: gliding motility-associated C-terminal domain-containing protein [Dysgonamonadaceae bacterium]|jgi:gliding motility-associated-like protein|nr:gliding motility-associated C-terminal domain-containing protein [Dysgonamonadaceae bacterium]